MWHSDTLTCTAKDGLSTIAQTKARVQLIRFACWLSVRHSNTLTHKEVVVVVPGEEVEVVVVVVVEVVVVVISQSTGF